MPIDCPDRPAPGLSSHLLRSSLTAGHGVNATHLAAKVLAEHISGETDERYQLFASVSHMTFPGGRLLRAPLLATGMLWHQFKELLR
ncbi:MAG: hypothetical protein LRY63_10100 [Nitrincola sp.]|nr:hypothetical protein [Nitrincola sp.]